MILVDTNSWVRHVRASDPQLVRILSDDHAATCTVVLGELLLGSGLPPKLIALLSDLPKVSSPSAERTHDFIVRHHRSFRNSGVGWADSQIIVAAADAGTLLYSADTSVNSVWRSLGYRSP